MLFKKKSGSNLQRAHNYCAHRMQVNWLRSGVSVLYTFPFRSRTAVLLKSAVLYGYISHIVLAFKEWTGGLINGQPYE
jgi:hypothetical protein